MTEGGEGLSPQNENTTADWVTRPRAADLTNVPIHKAQEAYEQRGTQVEFNAPEPGGRVIGDVNRVAVKDVPKAPWWDIREWFKRR